MEEERRKAKRLEIFLMVDIQSTGEKINYYLGMTKNLSADGFSFESQNYDIKIGALLELELKDTDDDFYVHTIGKIVWKKATDHECLLGVKFQGLEKEAADSIRVMTGDVEKVNDEIPVHASASSTEAEEMEVEEASDQQDGVISSSLNQVLSESVAQDSEENKAVAPEEPIVETIVPASQPHESPIEERVKEGKPVLGNVQGHKYKTTRKKAEGSQWYIKAAVIAAVIIAIPSFTLFREMMSDAPDKDSTEEIAQPLQVVAIPELSEVEMVGAPSLSDEEDTMVPEQSSGEVMVGDSVEESIVVAQSIPEIASPRILAEPELKKTMPENKALTVEPKVVVSKLAPNKSPVSQDSGKSQALMAVETIAKRIRSSVPAQTLTPVPEVVPEVVVSKEAQSVTRAKSVETIIKTDEKAVAKTKVDVSKVEAVDKIPEKAPSAAIPVQTVLPEATVVKVAKEAVDTGLVALKIKSDNAVVSSPNSLNQEEVAPIMLSVKKIEENKVEAPAIMLSVKKTEENKVPVPAEPEGLIDEFISYEDNFNDNANNWYEFTTNAASVRVEDGEYLLENKRDTGAHIVFHYYEFSHDNDFTIEAPVRTVGASGDYSYGFVFGGKDVFSNYVFQISDDQMFSVVRNQNGKPEKLAAGSLRGLSANLYNTIKIKTEGETARFYINGKLIAVLKNLSYDGNQIGFILDGKSSIAIDRASARIKK